MKRKGFTLIEMLTSLAVLAVLSVAISSVFVSLFRDWQRQRDYYRSFQDTVWALESISNEFRHANSTDCGILNPSVQQFSFIKDCQSSGSGCPSICSNWDRVYYWLNTTDNVLYRAEVHKGDTWSDINNAKEFSRSVAEANFTWNTSDGSLMAELTVRPFPQRAVGPGNQERYLRTRLRPRN